MSVSSMPFESAFQWIHPKPFPEGTEHTVHPKDPVPSVSLTRTPERPSSEGASTHMRISTHMHTDDDDDGVMMTSVNVQREGRQV